MIKTALAAVVLTVALAPNAHADPPTAGDYQFCAHVATEMANWPATAGSTVSDCEFMSAVGKGECIYFRQSGLFMQNVMQTTEKKYNWEPAMASIVLVYAVRDYCPEFIYSLPTGMEKTPGVPPPPGNVGHLEGGAVL